MPDCKHKIIIVNPMMQKVYCKKCRLDLSAKVDFNNKRIEAGDWEKSYAIKGEIKKAEVENVIQKR